MFKRIADGRTDLVFDHLASVSIATARDANDVRLIAWCAYHGDVSAIRALLAHGEVLESLGANFDLNGAAFHGHWQLCEFLLEHGADPNHALAESGEVPLHVALSKANRPAIANVVSVLLAHGADPNRVTLNGAETGAFMRDVRTRAETPLHRAAAFGDARSISALIDAGAQLDARDAHGESPLSWASWHLRPPPILRLLTFGEHSLHHANASTYDHGVGWTAFEQRGIPRSK
jgi:ankyrin repeat protein